MTSMYFADLMSPASHHRVTSRIDFAPVSLPLLLDEVRLIDGQTEGDMATMRMLPFQIALYTLSASTPATASRAASLGNQRETVNAIPQRVAKAVDCRKSSVCYSNYLSCGCGVVKRNTFD